MAERADLNGRGGLHLGAFGGLGGAAGDDAAGEQEGNQADANHVCHAQNERGLPPPLKADLD